MRTHVLMLYNNSAVYEVDIFIASDSKEPRLCG